MLEWIKDNVASLFARNHFASQKPSETITAHAAPTIQKPSTEEINAAHILKARQAWQNLQKGIGHNHIREITTHLRLANADMRVLEPGTQLSAADMEQKVYSVAANLALGDVEAHLQLPNSAAAGEMSALNLARAREYAPSCDKVTRATLEKLTRDYEGKYGQIAGSTQPRILEEKRAI